MVIVMLLISALMAVLYVGAVIVRRYMAYRRGDLWAEDILPVSISAMVFDLPRPWQWLWTAWLSLTAICLAPALFETLPEEWQWVGFLTVCMLLFTAANPLVVGRRNPLHNFTGVSAGVLSQICVLNICWPWLLPWGLMLVVLGRETFPDKPLSAWLEGRGTLVAEIVCSVAIYGALFVTLYTLW